eukprot:13363412-Alexandrium_andersonii.AAC.1
MLRVAMKSAGVNEARLKLGSDGGSNKAHAQTALCLPAYADRQVPTHKWTTTAMVMLEATRP